MVILKKLYKSLLILIVFISKFLFKNCKPPFLSAVTILIRARAIFWIIQTGTPKADPNWSSPTTLLHFGQTYSRRLFDKSERVERGEYFRPRDTREWVRQGPLHSPFTTHTPWLSHSPCVERAGRRCVDRVWPTRECEREEVRRRIWRGRDILLIFWQSRPLMTQPTVSELTSS